MKILRFVVLALLVAVCGFVQAQVFANFGAQILASGARTATINTLDQTNPAWKGGHFLFNLSSYTSGDFTPHIQGKDPVSGTYYDICVGPAISSAGLTVIKIYPGIGTIANGACSDVLPKTWRISMVGANTPSATFSIGYFGEY